VVSRPCGRQDCRPAGLIHHYKAVKRRS
jgi:hypothetical protein